MPPHNSPGSRPRPEPLHDGFVEATNLSYQGFARWRSEVKRLRRGPPPTRPRRGRRRASAGLEQGVAYWAWAAATALAAGDAATAQDATERGLATPEDPAPAGAGWGACAKPMPRWRAGIWSRPAAGPKTP